MIRFVVIMLSAFVAMEFVSYLAHRYVYHKLLWVLHKSHHVPRKGLFEWNDVFPTFFASIAIVLWHYLLTADGVAPADRWLTFRELPDGLFYSQAFAGHAEGLLAEKFGSDVEGFHRACNSLGGDRLTAAQVGGYAIPGNLPAPGKLRPRGTGRTPGRGYGRWQRMPPITAVRR